MNLHSDFLGLSQDFPLFVSEPVSSCNHEASVRRPPLRPSVCQQLETNVCDQLFLSCLQTEINETLYNSNTTPVVDARQTIS